MKLEQLLFYTFFCLIIWLFMSYSTLGNFEFCILFIIFFSYLLFLLIPKDQIDTFVQAPAPAQAPSKTQTNSNNSGVAEEIKKISKILDEQDKEINIIQQEDVIIEEEVVSLSNTVRGLLANTTSIVTDIQKMPGEIKKRFGAELDRLIYNVSPKTPSGDYVKMTSIDENFFKKIKKDSRVSKELQDEQASLISKYPGEFSVDEIKKMKYEYMLIDMLLRELYHVNKDYYNKLFYS